jgi:hypothetical protein
MVFCVFEEIEWFIEKYFQSKKPLKWGETQEARDLSLTKRVWFAPKSGFNHFL